MSILGDAHDRIDETVELYKLRAENGRLRDKLLAMARECAGCGGTGRVTERLLQAERTVPCEDCADIRKTLE